MDSGSIEKLLKSVKSGGLSVAAALKELRHLPFENLDFARVDHHRSLRQGVPEVVFAEGKRPEDVIAIAKSMYKKSKRFLITRANESIHKKLRMKSAKFHEASGVISMGGQKSLKGNVLVLSAGTSDIPVAEEAAVTARFLGSGTTTLYDTGVAGIHRLFSHKEEIEKANVIIVVAGMEGALPSVVGGLTDKPIVAVPTSVGYGTSLGGLTALFAMLNSCVPGIAVMNIDNGFGAGCLAHKINTLA
jgi:NCAIR mutase (PurE)-related protein